jgi:flagellar protein FliO/FliZ
MTIWLVRVAEAGDAATSVGSQLLLYAEVLLALGGVLVLAYVVLRVGLPRMFGLQISKNGPIQIVGRYPLEPKKTLYLVKMGSQLLLIAASDSQVQFLTAVDPANAAEMLAAVQVAEPQRKVFRQFMSSFRQS